MTMSVERVGMNLDEQRKRKRILQREMILYLSLFDSEIPDDASVKFRSSCRRKARIKHVLTLEASS